MLISKISVNGVRANATKLGTLTSGRVGAKVQFSFDSSWEGLSKTAVFRCRDIVKDVLNIDSEVTIPHEVLAISGSALEVGVYGTNTDGSLVIPTVWATVGVVYSGADPSGDPSTERSPEVWEQLQAQIDDLKHNGVPGTGEGVNFKPDKTLTLKDGVLSVNTVNQIIKDDPRPVTSGAVYEEFSKAVALLNTI